MALNPKQRYRLYYNSFKACQKCGGRENLTTDHIIPVLVLRAIGMPTNEKKNFQVLCKDCNENKGSVLDPHCPATSYLMRHYLNRWQEFYQIKEPRRKYVFKTIEIKSFSQDTTFFISNKKALENVYKKQKNTI